MTLLRGMAAATVLYINLNTIMVVAARLMAGA